MARLQRQPGRQDPSPSGRGNRVRLWGTGLGGKGRTGGPQLEDPVPVSTSQSPRPSLHVPVSTPMQDAEAGPASPRSTSPGFSRAQGMETRQGKGSFFQENMPPDPPSFPHRLLGGSPQSHGTLSRSGLVFPDPGRTGDNLTACPPL